MDEQPEPDGWPLGPAFPPAEIPTDPDELEVWKERFLADLLDHHQGGINVPWRRGDR